ncbi:ribbon-helix-helix domain-containing protein [Pseudoalteromonas ardens]|uniref:Arylsulfate sulfotransferase n=1 Tax=Pseudoalteromonas rubra TaxID=43658 RepID=A0A0L0ETW1_9GAMM|nr:ribbon-helix-helix domain-containing protein [Pseudoalteromonas sp. R96]KNC67318.1 arylsulfate sulfotransferase [Pseudoalteromonas rubra]MDK1312629.1 ribbon-helix-helix domain-containing protein [Pseudoalteromonas sp. R96]
MCELYAAADPASYEVIRRSMRIQGAVTSLALERRIWDLLQEIAAKEQLSVAEFVSTLYQEVLARQGEVKNLASLLRITCLTYLSDLTSDRR